MFYGFRAGRVSNVVYGPHAWRTPMDNLKQSQVYHGPRLKDLWTEFCGRQILSNTAWMSQSQLQFQLGFQ